MVKKKKKKSKPAAQVFAASATVPISAPSTDSPANSRNRSKAPYVAPVHPSILSRQEKRGYVHAKARADPIWVNEPLWVKIRRENHAWSHFQHNSAAFQTPLQGPFLSHTVPPFTAPQMNPPPPQLWPLIFTNPQSVPTDSKDKEAVHTAWWVRISNSLASHSARGYHLSVASTFLTCSREELLLLYEIRRLNSDGIMLFEEILRVLRARNSDVYGVNDEMRISWDMASKLKQLVYYDAYVAKEVARMERDMRKDASGRGYENDVDDDTKTVVDSHVWQEQCPTVEPICANSQRKSNASREESDKTVVPAAKGRKEGAPEDSPVKEALTNSATFKSANNANEAIPIDCENPVECPDRQQAALSNSVVDATPTIFSVPSPTDAPPRTWAQVVATPSKVGRIDPNPEMSGDAESSRGWGGISGEAWAWE